MTGHLIILFISGDSITRNGFIFLGLNLEEVIY